MAAQHGGEFLFDQVIHTKLGQDKVHFSYPNIQKLSYLTLCPYHHGCVASTGLVCNPKSTPFCGRISILTILDETLIFHFRHTLCCLFSNVLTHIEGFPQLPLQELVDMQEDTIPHPQPFPGSPSQAAFCSFHCSPSSMQMRLQPYKLLRVEPLHSFFKQHQENHKLFHLPSPAFPLLMLKG